MLRNELVPSSKSSSTPFLLLTKSMSAIEAATVPVKFIIMNTAMHSTKPPNIGGEGPT